MERNYWLFKSEPSTYSFDDLLKEGSATWDGVRNYKARNYMKNEMKVGDLVFYYHSSCEEPGIVGIAEVIKEAIPDDSQFDPKSEYYDPGSNPENPRWWMVTIRAVEKFPRLVSLKELRNTPGLEEMVILQKGNRLSITPVKRKEWEIIRSLATKKF
ncbi:MAG TPA: EVE domain-containing protein [Fimbriimonadales bacterium]|nr:EVE domain-containing protein [Fimbriimonadales bacterium]